MAFLTGKADITGGYIYGSEFCPLYIGKKTDSTQTDLTRLSELFTKHLDLKGELEIKDCSNNVRVKLDDNNLLQFSGKTNMDCLETVKLDVGLTTLCVDNTHVNINLVDDNQCSMIRTSSTSDTNYLCNITSENALEVNGKCNINGELFIDGTSLDDTIEIKVDDKFNNLSILSLSQTNDVAGLLVKTSEPNETDAGSGLVWKNNKFNLVKNVEFTDSTIGENELEELVVGDVTTTKVIAPIGEIDDVHINNIFQKIETFDLNTITTLTDIDTTTHLVSRFTNGNGTTVSFTLLNPTTDKAVTHQLVADHNFAGVIEVDGDFLFPDGPNENKKIKLTTKGQNVLLTYMGGDWYITNGGAEIV